MSTELPIVIEDSNLSLAWAKVLDETMKPGSRHLRPVVLSIGGFDDLQPPEVPELRVALDNQLLALGKISCGSSAHTIFPHRMWVRLGRPGCAEFSERCINELLPRMRQRNAKNQYGTYFSRMMAFTGTRPDGQREVNQLQFIIDLLNRPRRPRESALQISCFDPAKDHTGQPVRGFPCLQQVSISYDDDGGLAVNAFYPMQYIFDRAYGNYLGLCHLGEFIAHQTGLRFARLTCFIGKPERGDVTKGQLSSLHDLSRRTLRIAS